MIETPALIRKVEAGYAWVEPKPHKPCGMCDPEKGCRTLAIARLFSRTDQTFRVYNPLNLSPGEWVTVAVPERGMLSAALLLYIFPLIGLFGGALLGAAWGDIWSAAGAIVGLVAMACLVRCLPDGWAGRSLPRIVAKVDINVLEAERVCRSKNS